MTDIVEFLRARLGEDEAYVYQVTHTEPGYPAVWSEIWSGTVEVGDELIATNDLTLSRFIVHNDPARVLREVEAKRAIVAEHPPLTLPPMPGYPPDVICPTCAEDNENWGKYGDPYPCPTIRALAAVYDDHPDYDERWRP